MPANASKSGAGVVLFILPLLLLSGIFGLLGWIAAKAGFGRGAIKLLSMPAPFILSNMCGVLMAGVVCFIYSAVVGDKGALTYFFMHITDYSLSIIWGPIIAWFWNFGVIDFSLKVNVWLVVIYQVILYLMIGNWMANMLTNLILVFSDRPMNRK